MNKLAENLHWMVSEDTIERDIRRAVSFSRASDVNIWCAGFFVARVVGAYKVNAVIDIALEARRSTATIENYAHAYWMLESIRKSEGNSVARQLRKSFTPTHFWTAWELQRKYNLSNRDVMRYFAQLTAYKINGESHSTETLRREVEAEQETAGNPPSFVSYSKRLSSLVTGILAAKDTPLAWRTWAVKMPKDE